VAEAVDRFGVATSHHNAPKPQFGATSKIPMSEIQQVPNCLLGIDVSHYQGQIDWGKVSEAGVKFAFIKATDGLTGDPMAKANCAGAAAAGLPFGFYHFWRPQLSAQDQAQHFVATINDLIDGTGEVWFAAALDIETGALTEDAQEAGLAWLAEVEGKEPGPKETLVYVSPSYAHFNLTDPAWLEYPLWAAHYTDLSQPNIDKWPSWMFWQRQANATIPGITGFVDIDWFNGDATAFSKLIQLPT
jgi:lysozyme